MNTIKKRRILDTLASIHWALQQTALAMVSVGAFVVGALKFLAFAYMSTNSEVFDADASFAQVEQGLFCLAVGIVTTYFYVRRKQKYMEDHKGEQE